MVSEKLTKPSTPRSSLEDGLFRADNSAVEWTISDQPVDYPIAIQAMKDRADAIAAGDAREQVWLLEHPPLYTAGTSARAEDLLEPDKFPVYEAGRGGQYTYHGPGQRVAYVMLDLRQRGRDIRKLVHNLEGWIIDVLAAYNIRGERRDGGRVGVWVPRPERGALSEDKIAALGVRVSRWVSYHGVSLNVSPDLTHYNGIIPCGIADQGVTSFEDLGHLVAMEDVDRTLRSCFEARFGPTVLTRDL